MNARTSLGQWLLRREIAKAGNTATDLARRCGVNPSAITRLANGDRREPTLSLALAIHKHAGIRVEAWCSPYESSASILPRGNDEECRTEIEGAGEHS